MHIHVYLAFKFKVTARFYLVSYPEYIYRWQHVAAGVSMNAEQSMIKGALLDRLIKSNKNACGEDAEPLKITCWVRMRQVEEALLIVSSCLFLSFCVG